MRFIIALLSIGMLFINSIPVAMAQSSSWGSEQFENRLQRLERDVKTMERTVYRGETPPSTPNITSEAPLNAPQIEIRLSQVEDDMRELRGKLETLEFNHNQLNEAITRLQDSLKQIDGVIKQQQSSMQGPIEGITSPPTPLSPSMEGDSVYTLDVAIPDQLIASSPLEAYNDAFTKLKAGQFAEAQTAFEAFLAAYPNDTLAGNAQYWLGETFYVRRQFREAATAFVVGYQKYPDGNKAPDNLLKLALSLKELGQTTEACQSLQQLKTSFPRLAPSIQRRADEEMSALKCPAA